MFLQTYIYLDFMVLYYYVKKSGSGWEKRQLRFWQESANNTTWF